MKQYTYARIFSSCLMTCNSEQVASKIYDAPRTTIMSDALRASNRPRALMIRRYLITRLNEGHDDDQGVHWIDESLRPVDPCNEWWLSPHLVPENSTDDGHNGNHKQSFVDLIDDSEVEPASRIADKPTAAGSEGKRRSWWQRLKHKRRRRYSWKSEEKWWCWWPRWECRSRGPWVVRESTSCLFSALACHRSCPKSHQPTQ